MRALKESGKGTYILILQLGKSGSECGSESWVPSDLVADFMPTWAVRLVLVGWPVVSSGIESKQALPLAH